MVTAPVAPDTEMPVPAMFELLIVLLVYLGAVLGGLFLFTKEDWQALFGARP